MAGGGIIPDKPPAFTDKAVEAVLSFQQSSRIEYLWGFVSPAAYRFIVTDDQLIRGAFSSAGAEKRS